MPIVPPTDDEELDLPDEDVQDDVIVPEEAVILADEEPAVAVPELDPEIEAEISRALVNDELEETNGDEAPKAKTHQIPQSLIDKELEPDDLIDEGSI